MRGTARSADIIRLKKNVDRLHARMDSLFELLDPQQRHHHKRMSVMTKHGKPNTMMLHVKSDQPGGKSKRGLGLKSHCHSGSSPPHSAQSFHGFSNLRMELPPTASLPTSAARYADVSVKTEHDV